MAAPQIRQRRAVAAFRAGHADRSQVIDTLKDTFTQGRLTSDELDARTGQALAARTYAELDIASSPTSRPARPRCRRPRPPWPAAGRWQGRRRSRAASWSSRSPPCGPPPRRPPIRTAPVPVPIIPGLTCSFSWPLPPWSRHSASWRPGWPPRWSSAAPAGGRRPGRGRARPRPRPRTPRRHQPRPDSPRPPPARPGPTCALTSHRSASCPGGPGSTRRQASVGRGVTPMRPAPESAPPRLSRPDVNGTRAQGGPSRERGANVRKPRGALGLGEGVVGRQPGQQPPGGPGMPGPMAG